MVGMFVFWLTGGMVEKRGAEQRLCVEQRLVRKSWHEEIDSSFFFTVGDQQKQIYVEHMIKQVVNTCMDVIIYELCWVCVNRMVLKASMVTVGGLLRYW